MAAIFPGVCGVCGVWGVGCGWWCGELIIKHLIVQKCERVSYRMHYVKKIENISSAATPFLQKRTKKL